MSPRPWLAAIPLGLAAFFVQGQVPEWSLAAQQRLLGGADSQRSLALQQQLVQEGERALAAGDSTAAQQAFDRAAVVVHAPAVEMGLVRTYLQAGDYRRALSFASHAAGAHRNVPAGTALYAWLLHLGGQGVFARRLLSDALAAAPDDAGLLAVQAQIAQPWPWPEPVLLQAPLRVAPFASGAQVPTGARRAGTALLGADGRHALAPSALVPAGARLWVRNGLGQTVAARALPDAGTPGLVLLQLETALPVDPTLTASAQPPFAGSPGYTVEFGAGPDPQATWPVLRQGFLGRHLPGGDRLLGLDAPAGPRGGPVFDAFGRLAGMALPTRDGPDRLIAADRLAGTLGLRHTAGTTAQPLERAGVDSIYDTGLRVALQLLVAD